MSGAVTLSCRAVPAHEATRLVVRAAELLHAYGTPADRFEALIRRLARAVGLPVQVSFSPTFLLLAMDGEDGSQTFVRRVEPGDVELGRLASLSELLEDVIEGRVGVRIALRRIEAIAAARPRYPTQLVLFASVGASASAAILFGGGWRECLVAGVLGSILAMLARLAKAGTRARPLYEPFAAFVAAASSRGLAVAGFVHSDEIATLAALIVLLPGLSLSVALVEIATRHWVSGTTRLAGAGAMFLMLTFGVALGRAVVGGNPLAFTPADVTAASLGLATVVAAASFAVLFSVRPREWAWVVLAGAIAVAGGRAGVDALGPALGPFIGATGVGILGSIYSWRGGRPSLVVLLPGILMLVPGSIGFRALDLMVADDTVAGLQAAFETMLVATSLVAGLVIAAGLLPRTLSRPPRPQLDNKSTRE